MPDNLYSPGQKILSKEGRDNWDAIFGKPKYDLICVKYDYEEKVFKKIKVDIASGEHKKRCPVCGTEHLYGTMCHKCYSRRDGSDRFWFAMDIKE